MSAQRKLKKLHAANDLPKNAPVRRVTLIAIEPTTQSLRRFLASGILLFFAGLVGVVLWTPYSPLPAPIPAPVAVKTVPVPSHLPKSKAETLQIPASHLMPQTIQADDETVSAIAHNLDTMPVMNGKETPATIGPADEQSLTDQLTAAHELLQNGSYEEAQNAYASILASDAHNRDALMGMAYAEAQRGDSESAIETSKKLVHFYPHDAAANANLARLLKHQGDFESALLYMDKAAHAAPETMSYRLDLAGLYDRTGRKAEALMLYRQILAATEDAYAAALPLGPIQERVDYLERSGSTSTEAPSTTEPAESR